MGFEVTFASNTTKVAIGASQARAAIGGIDKGHRYARIMGGTKNALIKFGDVTVAASSTYTSGSTATGNVMIPAGSTQILMIPPDATHMSVIAEDGSSTGDFVWITTGRATLQG